MARALWRARRALILYAVLLVAGWLIGRALLGLTAPELRPMNDPSMRGWVTGALILYVMLAAIPFVPGAEIGLALLLMFGGQAAAVVYLGMVGALLLSYGVARLVPPVRLCGALRWMGLHRAGALVRDLAALPPENRADSLAKRMPKALGPRLMRNRYVVLAIAINTPGNSLLGGGGGLAFAAGLSGLYSFPGYLLTVLLAVAPVPLAFAIL